jgi:hypothetical protein
MSVFGVVTFPEGTAALNLHGLVETTIPVVVEYGGRRFALTGWDATYEVFDAIELLGDETPEQARQRVIWGGP